MEAERHPATTSGWRVFQHRALTEHHPNQPASGWLREVVRVISTVEARDGRPCWHLSVSIVGVRRLPRKHEVKRALRDFGLEAAIEDNTDAAIARHFWHVIPNEGGSMETETRTAAEWIEEVRARLAKDQVGEVIQGTRDLLDALQRVPSCALRIKSGQVGFTLISQDISAPMIVRIWAALNARLAHEIQASGEAPDVVIKSLEDGVLMFLEDQLGTWSGTETAKIEEAFAKADEMERYTPRKLAD